MEQEGKPNAWKLTGLQNVLSAIWIEADYQQFCQGVSDDLKDSPEAQEYWNNLVGTEEHRVGHVRMLTLLSP